MLGAEEGGEDEMSESNKGTEEQMQIDSQSEACGEHPPKLTSRKPSLIMSPQKMARDDDSSSSSGSSDEEQPHLTRQQSKQERASSRTRLASQKMNGAQVLKRKVSSHQNDQKRLRSGAQITNREI